MALEDLEKELYRPVEDEGLKKRQALSEARDEKNGTKKDAPKLVEEPFEDDEEDGGTSGRVASTIKKTFIWTIIVAGTSLFAVAGYLLYQSFTFSGIDIEAKYPERVLLGVPVDFSVNYSNNSGSVLRGAKIMVSLPPELAFVGDDKTKRVMTKEAGDIGVGTLGQEVFKVIALSGAQSSKRIQVKLEYSTAAFGSRFEKAMNADLFIGEPAVSLDFEIADKVLSGEMFDVKLNYKNISDINLNDLELRLEYPANFNFKTASIPPDTGNTVWRLGDLKPGSSNEVIIQGSIIAPSGSFFEIRAFLAASTNGLKYDIGETSKTIALSASPLSIDVTSNERTDYIAKADDYITYRLNFKNNTDVGFRDVIINAKLQGEMFDYRSVQSDGSFNSISNTISWNASVRPELRTLAAGQSGAVEFRVHVKPEYPISRQNDKDFTLKVEAEIESPTVPSFVAADRTIGIGTLITKVAGLVTVQSKVLFRDAASGILNKGTLPPKVNQPTQYTVHWILKNYGSDVQNIEVRGFLRSGVTFTGVMKSNLPTKPEYNSRTQEFIWKIPKLAATRGVIGEPPEAIFQIEATPAINQVDSTMPLMSETVVTSNDLFSGVDLRSSDTEATTQLTEDPTVATTEGRVTF